MHCLECLAQTKNAGFWPENDTFVVHAKLETPPVPGWMVIAPRSHITQYDDLNAAEQAQLGGLIGRVAQALRQTTPCEKVYVCVFAEQLEHLHVHVVARPPGYAVKGPAIFSEPAGDRRAFEEVARRVLDRLR